MICLFQCEYCQCFTFKDAIKFKLKCTSHEGMYGAHSFGKISIKSKRGFESILMKGTDIIYTVKIM